MMSSHNDSFVSSGSSPTVDFLCENHGSIFLLRAVSPSAFSWIEEHLPPDRITFGNAIAVDHRCIWACPSSVDDKHLYRTKLLFQSIDSLTQQSQETDHRPHARLGRSSLHFFLHSIMTSGAFPTANRESALTLSTSQTRPQPLQTPTRQWDLFCPPMVSGEPTDHILPDSDPFLPKGHPPPPHT